MNQTTDTVLSPRLRQDLIQRLAKKRKPLLWTGIGLTVLGLLAMLSPVVSTMVTLRVIGWIFMFAGIAGVFNAFSTQGVGSFFGALLFSLLSVAIGAYMIGNPGAGMVFLTVMIAATFIIEGAYQAAVAFELKPDHGWGWMLTSAIFAIGVGILIISGMPGTSLVMIGFLVGLNFFTTGFAMIMLANRLNAVSA
jgi:uncharacterized membrane protein HdeD (DUF308 family)